ncbi:PleD family two-component system response regulator [Maritimibacter sp. 55A14]|uniref:response regulator n=1 Tax=Maritimibacter sp. 55A14 TaxID=2174844 RepID=UPI001304F730|nr:response regulator [Maritimibacter sp. 55A14]
MKILAVDDDLMILDLLREAMAAIGEHEVETASSGEMAIELFRKKGSYYDCFLLDIQMPETDGIEVCKTIRATPGYKRTPIIMATAMSQKAYIERAFAAGATDYVVKPFDFGELNTRLRTAAKIAEQRMDKIEMGNNARSIQEVLNRNLSHSLEEPFEIQGVERLVGYVSFENFVLTLPLGSLLSSSLFAVKIANVDKIYAATTPVQFRRIMTDVAEAITDATEADGNLFSYRGNGIFLCLRQSGGAGSLEDLEKELNRALSGIVVHSGTEQRGEPLKLRIVVGSAASLQIINKPGSFRKATSHVEKRCDRIRQLDDPFGQDSDPLREDNARLQQKRNAYEALLKDCLDDSVRDIQRG